MLSSPFPGIDPYIKAQGSCRTSTPASSRICAMRWLISCPFNYEARIDERLNLVELPAEKLRRIKPDLAVSRGELSRGPSPVSAGVVTLEPVTIPLVIEEEARETYIEILHRPDRTFVTVIELLSPSNKEDPGRAVFSTTFERGHYARSLDYTSPFPSSVDDQLQRWIQETAQSSTAG